MNQWTSQAPWLNLYSADRFWSMVENMTATGESESKAEKKLNDELKSLIEQQKETDDVIRANTSGDREIGAHTLSNVTPPLF